MVALPLLRLALTGGLLALLLSLSGQDRDWQLRASAELTHELLVGSWDRSSTTITETRLRGPQVALLRETRRGHWHVVELSELAFQARQGQDPNVVFVGLEPTSAPGFRVQVGYQFNWTFLRRWARVHPYLGTGAWLRYHYLRNAQMGGTFFQWHALRGVFRLSPGVQIDLQERLFVQVELPLDVIGADVREFHLLGRQRARFLGLSGAEPFLPIDKQIALKLGLGVRL